ncbi:transporter substrate-binding domain-containing protein, partial [Klebsiella quasipneumoniae]
MSKKLTAIILGVFVLALALAGCGGQADQKQAAKPKVLKVGTEPSFAPFEFQEEGSKEYTGFDMDLIRA